MSDPVLANMRIAVVVLNYRTPELTVDCLRSLVPEIPQVPGVHVYVVDNDSPDDSVAQISGAITTEQWNWVTFLPQQHNGGYAYGNNAAIRVALAVDPQPDYILLLNPDTVIHPGAIQTLVEFMDANPKAGIAGSRLEDPDGTAQRSAFRFPSFLGEIDSGLRLGVVTNLLSPWVVAPPVPEGICETDWVAGASMIVRREVFEAVGLMDENYFLYFEEVDFCLAAQRAGWSCWYVPESRVVHYVGQSSGVTDTKKPAKRLPTYWFDSRRRFFSKNYGWFYTVLTETAWASSYALWQVRRSLQGKPDTDPPYFLSDFLRNSIVLKGGASR
jgi:N-acetylglucosaminyl-diphospho-decaprenol L-rhamnosyltransferase